MLPTVNSHPAQTTGYRSNRFAPTLLLLKGITMEQSATFANGSTHNTNGSASNPVLRGVETAGTALHTGIDKVADPTRSAIDRASAVAHKKVDQLTDGALGVADRFSEQTRRVADAPQRAVDYSVSYVQAKPLQTVGVALALGFLIGRLTAR
jgi:ElaB/YqjD/DUF883 family membrane-anchored ribosome-binding protein